MYNLFRILPDWDVPGICISSFLFEEVELGASLFPFGRIVLCTLSFFFGPVEVGTSIFLGWPQADDGPAKI